jgi:thiol:disulfide interchange protein DsbD
VACGAYLMGWYRLPHDSPVEHLSVPRMLLASMFFGLALYMLPALARQTPLGTVGRGLVAFLPKDTRPNAEEGWYLDYREAWAQAVRENKPIFIDFTGVNCTNCRSNENNVFPDPRVTRELKKYVRVRLYTDSVPDPDLTPGEASAAARRNQAWEQNTFGELSNPLYVIFQPDRDAMEQDGKLKGTELARYAGLIENTKDFVKLLRSPGLPEAPPSTGVAARPEPASP